MSLEEDLKEAGKVLIKENYNSFDTKMRAQHDGLANSVKKGEYDSPHSEITIGHEVEGSFLSQENYTIPDHGLHAQTKVNRFLKSKRSKELTKELGEYNFEINTKAKVLKGRCFHEEHEGLKKELKEVTTAGIDQLLVPHFTGLVENASVRDVSLNHLVAEEKSRMRYLGINLGVMARREDKINIAIKNGKSQYKNQFDSIMFEALCNSLQQHILLRDPVEDFAKYMNSAMILAAPMVAVAGNSPFVLGKGPYWKDSRITIFEQSIDSRREDQRQQYPTENLFPHKFYDGIFEFLEQTRDAPTILPDTMFGKDLNLQAPLFRLQIGTDWRWIRPVWHQNGENKYMTLEFRPLSSGPTVVDMIANSALYFGGLQHFVENKEYVDFPEEDFAHVRKNFYQAAKYGMDAELYWKGEQKPVAGILHELIGYATDTLKQHGVDEIDVGRYLDVITHRVECKESPSDSKIAIVRSALASGSSQQEAICQMVNKVQYHLREDIPLVGYKNHD
jgi:hypothetical protein